MNAVPGIEITLAGFVIYRVGHKNGPHNSVKLTDLRNFFTLRFLCKFAVKCLWKIPLHLAYVATLPRETLMSAKQVINDKLQGSVAAYLRCAGVVNNQIKKGLLLSLGLKKILKSVNIWQSYKQKCDCFMHFLHLLTVCWPSTQSAWDNHILACNFAKYSPI